MRKKILITGATSGIGLGTARTLAAAGHHLLLHGRSAAGVETLKAELAAVADAGPIEGYVADLSRMNEVEAFAAEVGKGHDSLDVLINNAGVLKTAQPITAGGHDVRFIVNTVAPWVLAQRLLPLLRRGRVINVSSAAQNSVNLDALAGRVQLPHFEAYAQSKLALTMWSSHLGRVKPDPVFVAVNPGSMLGTNMVREGFGVTGNDVSIGSDILVRAALSDAFADASGKYFDNDARRFARPHADALDPSKCERVIAAVENLARSL